MIEGAVNQEFGFLGAARDVEGDHELGFHARTPGAISVMDDSGTRCWQSQGDWGPGGFPQCSDRGLWWSAACAHVVQIMGWTIPAQGE